MSLSKQLIDLLDTRTFLTEYCVWEPQPKNGLDRNTRYVTDANYQLLTVHGDYPEHVISHYRIGH